MSHDGFPISLIFGLAYFGLAIGVLASSVVIFVKHGRPKLRGRTE